MSMRPVFTLLVSLALPALAQPGFHGPVSGFVYASRSVRPLQGPPGSALLGAAVVSDVDWASVAPSGTAAVITKEGHSGVWLGLSGEAPSQSSPEGLIDAIDRAVWNRDGSVAWMYSSSGAQLQRLRISGGAASVDPAISLAPFGDVTTFAVDPNGAQVVFGVVGGLYRVQGGIGPNLLGTMGRPSAAAFDETGNRLYVVDADTQAIFAFEGGGSFQFASLAQTDGPVADSVGLGVSTGGRYVLLADRAIRAVRVYDGASGALTATLPLDFAPSCLEAISANSVFLLNRGSNHEWLLLLDARQFPSIYFVPVTNEELL